MSASRITPMITAPPAKPPAWDVMLILFEERPYTRLTASVVMMLGREKP